MDFSRAVLGGVSLRSSARSEVHQTLDRDRHLGNRASDVLAPTMNMGDDY